VSVGVKYVSSDVDRHGNKRSYFRVKGQPKIRLEGDPGSAVFEDCYLAVFRSVLSKIRNRRKGSKSPTLGQAQSNLRRTITERKVSHF
jgi:hypothetical protein